MAIHPEFQLDGGARQAGLAMTHSMGSFAASSAVLRLPPSGKKQSPFPSATQRRSHPPSWIATPSFLGLLMTNMRVKDPISG